jgi:hypothetical protein
VKVSGTITASALQSPPVQLMVRRASSYSNMGPS